MRRCQIFELHSFLSKSWKLMIFLLPPLSELLRFLFCLNFKWFSSRLLWIFSLLWSHRWRGGVLSVYILKGQFNFVVNFLAKCTHRQATKSLKYLILWIVHRWENHIRRICKIYINVYFQQQDFAFYSQFFEQIQSKICFDEFEITFLLFYYYHYYYNIDEDAADLKWHLVMAHTHTGTAN